MAICGRAMDMRLLHVADLGVNGFHILWEGGARAGGEGGTVQIPGAYPGSNT